MNTIEDSIESPHNPRYKQWSRFARRPEHRECPWIPLESWKIVAELSQSLPIRLLLWSEAVGDAVQALVGRSDHTVRLSSPLLKKISQVEQNQGLVAFFDKPAWTWDQATDSLLYLDRLQDPANLGALIRSAEATGLFTVVTSPGSVSCFNPKVARASAAALFRTPFMERVPLQEVERRGYRLSVATPRATETLFETDLEAPLAIVLGNEGSGVRQTLRSKTRRLFSIPMENGVESLNTAVAGSLILYEAYRRRLEPHRRGQPQPTTRTKESKPQAQP